MKNIKKQVLLPYSCEQMYQLVVNVANYPKFLPWCGGVEIFKQDESLTDAKIHIDFKGIKQFFHTHNIQKINSSIDMHFVEGPFKHFRGQWIFNKLNEKSCKVQFNLEYEFSSKILETIIGPLFNIITSTFVDSFVKQAKKVYL